MRFYGNKVVTQIVNIIMLCGTCRKLKIKQSEVSDTYKMQEPTSLQE